ncbi:MAG: alpha/beta hydrolase, partial [Bacteroidota bacterium]|nr:alpha/beta hydrolase [Bacteroidota bacterium]
MLHQEYTWRAFDNTKLFAQSWQTKEKPKVVINLIHGLGEHSGRYSQWSEWFQNQNCAVLAFDLRGHGRSEGKRGYTPSYQHLMKDIDLLLKKSQL